VDLLERVGVPNPSARAASFPHQLSGGTRQRVVIAMAVANRPRLLIADEPTTALDVTVQAQILDLIAELQREYGMAVLMITHDLGVVAALADSVAVMYGGRIVEAASCEALFARPTHPYTMALLEAASGLTAEGRQPLRTVPGQPASAANLPPGCSFSPRCSHASETSGCTTEVPMLGYLSRSGHRVACHLTNIDEAHS
jgi:oligopeptide/dipeptide ABC transporter ATP-binding protein